MLAKSVADRLQKLRHQGPYARRVRNILSVLGLITALVALALVIYQQRIYLPFSNSYLRLPITQELAFPVAEEPPATVQSHVDEGRYHALAEFLARKYKVSQTVIQGLVGMAYSAGREIGIDPLLIISVMAVESRFNPIAESMAGARGLMQVIPKYHTDKFKGLGGEDALFDPQTNILVGSQILKEYISRTGSVNAALQMYAGALEDQEDIYTSKVMTEKERLQQVVTRSAPRPVPTRRTHREETTDATPI
jgi:transglycosylase-like protein with SLT domain